MMSLVAKYYDLYLVKKHLLLFHHGNVYLMCVICNTSIGRFLSDVK